MSPPRLFASSTSASCRELLSAGMAERPRKEARLATAAALGVSTTLAISGTATAASAGAAAALASPSLPLIALKWVAIGTLGGVALAGGAALVTEGGSPAKPFKTQAHQSPKKDVPVATTPAVVAAPVTKQNPTPWPAPAIQSTPASPMTSRAPALAASASMPSREQRLSHEVALIDDARRALAAANGGAALRLLDEYAALVRTGTLDREAQLLRIDALAQSGQRARALPLAERYLTSYPNDPHAARLRVFIANAR